MGQDDGRLDYLERSQNSVPNPPHAGGIVPVGLYLSHAAMRRPHALGHRLALKIPSSFPPDRVKSDFFFFLDDCMLIEADHVPFISFQKKTPNCVKTKHFTLQEAFISLAWQPRKRKAHLPFWAITKLKESLR